MEFGRPNSERKSEHADWGYYWSPFTNTIVRVNERMATDHIYPDALIRELPGFDKLTDYQKKVILNYEDNFQPLPTSLNSSKKDNDAEKWQSALGQSFHPDYVRDAKKYEKAIKEKLVKMIFSFNEANELANREAKMESHMRGRFR